MTLVLRGATLIDGTGADPRPDATVVADAGRITAIDELGAPAPGAEGTELLDLEGCTLLPGLIDAHTHLGIAFELQHHGQAGHLPAAEVAARIFRVCRSTLMAGFTTCRDLGGLDGGIVRAIDAGLVEGPRILPSGPAIAQDGGHASFMAPFSDCWCPLAIPGLVEGVAVANGPDEVRLAARRALRRGATQVKVMVSGGVISLTDEIDHTQLTVEELRAAVVEAEARNTYVTAHAHNVRGIHNGLAAGVRCFEHGSWLDEETASAVASAGAALVPTLTVMEVMASEHERWGLPPSVAARVGQVGDDAARAVKIARDAGVTMGSGSDLLGPDQDRRGLELALRARIEGPMAAIVAATTTNARILRVSDRLGSVEPGKTADLVAVGGDPLAEPTLFDDPGRVVLVVKDGVVKKNLLAAR
ncbi:MAG TPA: amidohydrolase family protein [Acidimicrobiia bacterium]